MHGITIVGPGRMGGALALALNQSGVTIDAIIYRHRGKIGKLVSHLPPPRPMLIQIDNVKKISSQILIIATQDEDLPEVPPILADKVPKGSVIFHTSGSISSEILAAFRDFGCQIGSIHPLASISSFEDGPERFVGTFFCLEGDPNALRAGRRLVKKLRGRPFELISGNKPLYHAAALTAAGHVTALFDVAIGLMVKSGLGRRQAREILQPLLFGVAENLSHKDTPAALTGTFARGDEATLSRHLTALTKNATKDEFSIYLDLAERSIDLAERRGSDKQKTAKMRRSIKMAKVRNG